MRLLVVAIPLLLAACQTENGARAPGTSPEGFDAIGKSETIRFTGTEPFWSGKVSGESLTYKTPENADGIRFAVRRFSGQGACSDGMSDRTYPYTVTLKIGDDTREGCAWTDAQPFEGPEAP